MFTCKPFVLGFSYIINIFELIWSLLDYGSGSRNK